MVRRSALFVALLSLTAALAVPTLAGAASDEAKVTVGSPPTPYLPNGSNEPALAMARRYLGTAGGDGYVAANPDPGRQNVAFRMRPEHRLSQDQGKGQARVGHPE